MNAAPSPVFGAPANRKHQCSGAPAPEPPAPGKRSGVKKMNTQEQETKQNTNERARPQWAAHIHNLGDDIAFACRGWNDIPPTVRRTGAFAVGIAGGKAAGLDEVIDGLIQLLEN